MTVPVLRTERLILRGWDEQDRVPFAELNADSEVMAHFPARLTRAESDAFVHRIERHFAQHGFGLWAVEVGWRLRRSAWGRGSHGEDSTMSEHQVGPDTTGVAVELLATVDLGPEIQGMDGRQLRMRMVTIEPGGVFGPVHDHKGRPGTVYVRQGTITDHRDGTVPAVEISVDVVRHE